MWGTGSPLRQFIYNVDLGALMVGAQTENDRCCRMLSRSRLFPGARLSAAQDSRITASGWCCTCVLGALQPFGMEKACQGLAESVAWTHECRLFGSLFAIRTHVYRFDHLCSAPAFVTAKEKHPSEWCRRIFRLMSSLAVIIPHATYS